MGIGLSAGLRALTAARLGIETTGQNVANANTPGYSRQQLIQSATLPFTFGNNLQIGTGVQITDIRRLADAGLERRIRAQLGTFGSAQVDFARWSEIESVFNEPSGGLSNNFTDFFGSVGKLQTQPSSRALRGGALQEGAGLANAINQLDRRFRDIESSSFTEIDGHVRRINELSQSIAKLNDQIAVMEASGNSANDLRDTREQTVKEISDLIGVNVLERKSGAIDVQIGGLLLVAGRRVNTLTAKLNSEGRTEVKIVGNDVALKPTSGKIEGLLRHEGSEIPAVLEKLDKLAKNLALEFNRIHSTGVPLAGYYESSLSAIGVKDLNGNGVFGDDLLTNSGLPFDIENGDLYVSVTEKATGDIVRTKVPINPASMSLENVAEQLSAITNLNATVDPTGHLRVTASAGYGYDFSPRLDTKPDDIGTFGGAQPSMASSGPGPFNLTVPSTLRITIDGTDHDVNFQASQFSNPAAATVDEVVAAINATPGLPAAGLAANVGGRLAIRANTSGTSATLAASQPGPGTPLADLGLPTPPNTRTGQAKAVVPTLGGRYTGEANDQYTFVAEGSGTIGKTAGLTVGVYDSAGVKIATLDAGPETELLEDEPVKVANGITLSLSPGDLSEGQVFGTDVLADSDTSDILVAIGMNSFFHGSTAADLAINPELADKPNLLAASLNGEEGDASNLDRLLQMRDLDLPGLDSNSVEDFYGDIVGEIGFEASGAETILFAEDQLLGALAAQREAVSGVNLDEEMIELVRYQQAFEAASRYINTVNELMDSVINMVR